MPLRTEQGEEPNINLTPMIDVVLNLMIFFMVGTQFIELERQYEISLPTVTEAQPLTSLPDEIIVNVSKDGTLYLGQDKIDVNALEARLRDARKRYAEQMVVIRGDGEGRYQEVMSVLNVCRRAGISNIQLANLLQSESGS
jgi:biopolymer transport protein ExbD